MYKKQIVMPGELLFKLANLQSQSIDANTLTQSVADDEIEIEDILGLDELWEAVLNDSDEVAEKQLPVKLELSQDYVQVVEMIMNHPCLKQYDITKTDVRVLSSLWTNYQSGKCSGWYFKDLLKPLKTDSFASMDNIKLVHSWLDRNILRLDTRNKWDYHKNTRSILDGSFELDSMFVNALLGCSALEDSGQSFSLALAKTSNKLITILEYVREIFSAYPELSDDSIEHPGNRYGNILKPSFRLMMESFDLFPADSVIGELKDKYTLSDDEILVILLIFCHYKITGDNPETGKVINLLSTSEMDDKYWANMFEGTSNLFRHGLLENGLSICNWRKETGLSDFLKSDLNAALYESNPETKDWKVMLKDENRLSIVKTKQTIDQLILQDEIKDIIRNVVEKLRVSRKV
jgi:hypothetical protein